MSEATAEDRTELPVCQLTGEDGNAYNVIARVNRALLDAGMPERVAEWRREAFASRSYDELLGKTYRHVDVR